MAKVKDKTDYIKVIESRTKLLENVMKSHKKYCIRTLLTKLNQDPMIEIQLVEILGDGGHEQFYPIFDCPKVDMLPMRRFYQKGIVGIHDKIANTKAKIAKFNYQINYSSHDVTKIDLLMRALSKLDRLELKLTNLTSTYLSHIDTLAKLLEPVQDRPIEAITEQLLRERYVN